jgi:hypothetical protein
MRVTIRCFIVGLIGLLFGCGRGGATQPPFPPESAYDTATIEVDLNTTTTSYMVHRDGTAQRVTQTCCPQSTSSPTNKAIPVSLSSKLFTDLQAAQPLNALPSGLNSDFALTVSWNGQETPNLEAVFAMPDTMEQTLLNDADAIVAAFQK